MALLAMAAPTQNITAPANSLTRAFPIFFPNMVYPLAFY
jgi:hypothetical protein